MLAQFPLEEERRIYFQLKRMRETETGKNTVCVTKTEAFEDIRSSANQRDGIPFIINVSGNPAGGKRVYQMQKCLSIGGHRLDHSLH